MVETATAQAIVAHEALPPAPPAITPVSEATALIQMIERAARDPAVDIAKMRELLAMKKEIEQERARIAYDEAFSRMWPHIPTIDQNGRIVIHNKDDRQKNVAKPRIEQSTPYALMADINEAIKPVLSQYGFAIFHRSKVLPDGKISVTGIMTGHGHREETSFDAQHDSTGSKNSVQAVASTISYGIRQTTRLLANVTSRAPQDMRADDDGKAAGAGDTISADQYDLLFARMTALKVNSEGFFKRLKIDSLGDLPSARFDDAAALLDMKERQNQDAVK